MSKLVQCYNIHKPDKPDRFFPEHIVNTTKAFAGGWRLRKGLDKQPTLKEKIEAAKSVQAQEFVKNIEAPKINPVSTEDAIIDSDKNADRKTLFDLANKIAKDKGLPKIGGRTSDEKLKEFINKNQ